MTGASRPGPDKPTALEVAILDRMAVQDPSIGASLVGLRVLSRDFTGAGSFTEFRREFPAAETQHRHIGLDVLIRIPALANGLGAVLFCKGNTPERLEVYTFGEDWDGVFDGFSIEETAQQGIGADERRHG
jgi:hypothetical protein